MDRVDVLIVTAHRTELDAVLTQGEAGEGGWTRAQDESGAPYYFCLLQGGEGRVVRVAATWLGEPGAVAATMRTRRLVDELDPAWITLCGICAGLQDNVSLGDVIVADKVYDIDTSSKSGGEVTPSQVMKLYSLDPVMKMYAAELARDTIWLDEALRNRPLSPEAQGRWLLQAIFSHNHGRERGGSPSTHAERKAKCPDWVDTVNRLERAELIEVNENGQLVLTEMGFYAANKNKVLYPDGLYGDPPFRIHQGAVATVNRVSRATDAWERLANHDRKTFGIDAESAAICSVAYHMNRRWFVVKAAADHADTEKTDTFRDFSNQISARFLLEFIRRHAKVQERTSVTGLVADSDPTEPLLVDRLHIKGFKNIVELDLEDLSATSKLGGRWTCLAGINGSGKTAILQALVLALLGDKHAREIGATKLAQMVRQAGEDSGRAEISVTVRIGTESQQLTLPLSEEGIDSARLSGHPHRKEMRSLWEQRARQQVLVAYGASRNLSEHLDNRHEDKHPEVQRQMTLFDPLARVARAGLILSEDAQHAPVLHTLRQLLKSVLEGLPIKLASEEHPSLRFEMDGAVLPVTALPDGFRSTIAWLADLCAAWHEKARPEDKADGDPRHIQGIVLIDEIDLHLHPSLQRVLVPRLRHALPHVQWFVTTHSPLVLASFDRQEIKMLDSSEPGGVRQLDREIFGFTTDQIYDWLMGTPPRGVVLEEMLRQNAEGTRATPPEELAVLVAQSPEFNEEDARKRVAWRRELLGHLKQWPVPGEDAPAAPKGDGEP